MIKIDTFKPEYLRGHVNLGQKIVSNWLGGQQTPLERLKKSYSGKNFNPKEKFYAIDHDNDDKVVGFLTSSIKTNDEGEEVARMEFPVLDPSQERETGIKLIVEAINYFKNENVTEVISRASTAWGETLYYVKKYGFEHDRVLWKAGRLKVSEYEFQSKARETKAVNLDKDQKDITEIFQNYYGMSKEKAENKIERLSQISDRIVNWSKIVDQDEILALSELVRNKYDPTNAHMYSIYTSSKTSDEHRDQIMDAHVRMSRKQKIDTIDNFFEPPLMKETDNYQKYGYNIHQVSFYTKNIG